MRYTVTESAYGRKLPKARERKKGRDKTMKCITVKELYRNTESYLDKEITVAGWVRSNRGSKAFGFLVMGDGSCFQTLQIVYHDNMENFKEISKLNVGAAVIVKGTLVATPEAKAALRDSGRRGHRRGRFRAGLSAAEEAPLLRVSENHSPSACQNQYFPGCIPGSLPDCLRDSPVLPRERLLYTYIRR